MSALQVQKSKEQQVAMVMSTTYSPEVKKYMTMALDDRFCKKTAQEQALIISNELERAIQRNGQSRLTDEEKGFSVTEIRSLVLERPYITCEELSVIFKKGSLGLFGEFYGVNVKSISGWIDIFYKSAHRMDAIKKLNELQKYQANQEEMTPVDKEAIIRDAIIRVFEDRKKNGWIGTEGISYPMYDYLFRKKIINPSEQKKQYLKEEAAAHLKTMHGKPAKDMKELYEQGRIDPIHLAKVFCVRDWMNEIESIEL